MTDKKKMKDWSKILAEISSGEDSDEYDDLNILSVQRNAHRVTELLHGSVPGLDPEQMRNLPRGANKLDFFKAGMAKAMRDAHEATMLKMLKERDAAKAVEEAKAKASEEVAEPSSPSDPVRRIVSDLVRRAIDRAIAAS